MPLDSACFFCKNKTMTAASRRIFYGYLPRMQDVYLCGCRPPEEMPECMRMCTFCNNKATRVIGDSIGGFVCKDEVCAKKIRSSLNFCYENVPNVQKFVIGTRIIYYSAMQGCVLCGHHNKDATDKYLASMVSYGKLADPIRIGFTHCMKCSSVGHPPDRICCVGCCKKTVKWQYLSSHNVTVHSCSDVCTNMMMPLVEKVFGVIEKVGKPCQNCYKTTAEYKRCSGCKKAYYCSLTCQKDDWFNHGPSCH